MSKWPSRALGEVCEINPKRNGAERLPPSADVSFVPMAAVDESSGTILGAENRTLGDISGSYTPFRDGDVLFAKITPCMENGKAAIARGLANGCGFGSTEFHVLRCRSEVLPRWIFAFVRQPWFREVAKANFTGTAGQQRVPVDFLRTVPIPLPPLPEQERIVRILGEAEALRRLRLDADERYQTLIPSLYLRAFWKVKERQSWNAESVGDLAESQDGSIRTGPFGSQLLHSEFVEVGVPVLGIDNVVTNEFRWTAPRCIPVQKYRQFERFRVFPQDVLVTIMGTVGRTCVAPDDLPLCMSTKHLCVITLDRTKVHPRFLWAALLFDPGVRQQIGSVGGGAIMEGWNATIIRQLTLYVPPLARQHEFANRIAEIRALKAAQAASRQRLDDLFQSLLHRALQGEL